MGATFSYGLLQCLGWYLPADYYLDRVANCKRLIVVISHTSYWDFFLLLLYRQCDNRIKKNLYIIMKPQPFHRWGWFLRPLGAIPATRAEDSKGGFVQSTLTQFGGQEVRLIVSPEGKMEPNPWRSGYYHLCRGLKADIVTAGVDYERKTLHVGPLHRWANIQHLSRTDLEKQLQTEMGQIVPLYPDLSYTPIIREYDRTRISATDPYPLILIGITLIIVIIIIILLWRGRREEKRREVLASSLPITIGSQVGS